MSIRKRTTEPSVVSASPTTSEVFSKAVRAGAEWSDKDEFLDVVYWLRQVSGVLLGVIWGIVPLKGFIGLALFLALSTLLVYVYSNSFQRVDDEEMGGYAEILKEGLMTSFATFLISWIIVYSALHF